MESTMNTSGPKVETSRNVAILTFTGNSFRLVENQLAAELATGAHGLVDCHLLLDFSNVDRINSEELGTLIRVQRMMKTANGRLTLFNLGALVYEVFTVTHLHRMAERWRDRFHDQAPSGSVLRPRRWDRNPW